MIASASSPGASGGSVVRRVESTLELEDAETIRLASEVRGKEAVRLGPELRELAGGSHPDAQLSELDRRPAGRQSDHRRDRAVLVAAAEEGELELAVRASERAVVPVEAPARLRGRRQEREQDGGEERLAARPPRPGMRRAKIAAAVSRGARRPRAARRGASQ